MISKFDLLLSYLETLSKIQASGHYVNEEIKEAVKAIREELGLSTVEKNVKDSRLLIFKAQLGHEPTLEQRYLFEAVFSDEPSTPVVAIDKQEAHEAIKALQKIAPKVNFDIESNSSYTIVKVTKR